VLVFAGTAQIFVADEHVVDVLHLERKVVQTGAFIPHAEEGVMVNIIVTGIDPAELTDDVLLIPDINVVRADQTERLAEPAHRLLVLRGAEDGMTDPFDTGWPSSEPNDLTGPVQRRGTAIDWLTLYVNRLRGLNAIDLDRVAVGFRQADPLTAAGFIDALDT
jgi:hypothetical protein